MTYFFFISDECIYHFDLKKDLVHFLVENNLKDIICNEVEMIDKFKGKIISKFII